MISDVFVVYFLCPDMGRTSYENYLPHDYFLPVVFLPAFFCQLGHPMSMAVHNATLGSILEYSISHPQPLPTNYTTPCLTQQFNNFTSNKSPKHPGPYLISPRFNHQESQQPTPKNKVLTFQPHEQQPPFPSGPTLIFFSAQTNLGKHQFPSLEPSLSFWTAVSWTR